MHTFHSYNLQKKKKKKNLALGCFRRFIEVSILESE